MERVGVEGKELPKWASLSEERPLPEAVIREGRLLLSVTVQGSAAQRLRGISGLSSEEGFRTRIVMLTPLSYSLYKHLLIFPPLSLSDVLLIKLYS